MQFAAAMAVAGMLLSMGSYLHIDGHKTGIPLPFDVLAHLPLLESGAASRYVAFFWSFAADVPAGGGDHQRAARVLLGRVVVDREVAQAVVDVGRAEAAATEQDVCMGAHDDVGARLDQRLGQGLLKRGSNETAELPQCGSVLRRRYRSAAGVEPPRAERQDGPRINLLQAQCALPTRCQLRTAKATEPTTADAAKTGYPQCCTPHIPRSCIPASHRCTRHRSSRCVLQRVGTEDGRWMPSQTSGYARAGAITLVGPGGSARNGRCPHQKTAGMIPPRTRQRNPTRASPSPAPCHGRGREQFLRERPDRAL